MECSHYISELNQTYPLWADESFECIREEALNMNQARCDVQNYLSPFYICVVVREHLLAC